MRSCEHPARSYESTATNYILIKKLKTLNVMDDVNDIYYHNTRNPFNTATCQGQWNFPDS